MIEHFKRELAHLNNDDHGYWQFRQIVEKIVGDNDTYLQLCMQRFGEFPIDVIEEEFCNNGASSNNILALGELMRLREAALTEPLYWIKVFKYFADTKDGRFHGLSMILESIIPILNLICSRSTRLPFYQYGTFTNIIRFCLGEDFDECEDAIYEIGDIITACKLPDYYIARLKEYIAQIPYEDGEYNVVGVGSPTKLQSLRISCNLPV